MDVQALVVLFVVGGVLEDVLEDVLAVVLDVAVGVLEGVQAPVQEIAKALVLQLVDTLDVLLNLLKYAQMAVQAHELQVVDDAGLTVVELVLLLTPEKQIHKEISNE